MSATEKLEHLRDSDCEPCPPVDRAAEREFEAIALPWMGSLYGQAMRMTRDPAEAEDLVQDAMIRAFRFWHTFEHGTNIKAWLFTILRNTFINGYNQRGRKRDVYNDISAQMGSLGPAVAIANLTPEPTGPEEATSAEMRKARIRAALNLLPERYRLAIEFFEIDSMSYKEIADLMECPVGTVMSRIYRGRRILERLLREQAFDGGLVADPVPVRRVERSDKPDFLRSDRLYEVEAFSSSCPDGWIATTPRTIVGLVWARDASTARRKAESVLGSEAVIARVGLRKEAPRRNRRESAGRRRGLMVDASAQ